MTTFSIYGHRSVPAALVDERDNVVIFKNTASEEWFERLARASVVVMGGSAVGVEAPMSGQYVKRAAVPATWAPDPRRSIAVTDTSSSNCALTFPATTSAESTGPQPRAPAIYRPGSSLKTSH